MLNPLRLLTSFHPCLNQSFDKDKENEIVMIGLHQLGFVVLITTDGLGGRRPQTVWKDMASWKRMNPVMALLARKGEWQMSRPSTMLPSHLPAISMGPWASSSLSLGLNSLICKIYVIMAPQKATVCIQ